MEVKEEAACDVKEAKEEKEEEEDEVEMVGEEEDTEVWRRRGV